MAQKFSLNTRQKILDQISDQTTDQKIYDLVIIGGGITGTGVAWDAASRGLKVLLLEKEDFASGTSSKSSKLIHGGLRYLEKGEFKLVFEALSERTHLLKQAPFRVSPLQFCIPVYAHDRVPMWKMSIGLWIYDALSLFRTPGVHQRLSKSQVLKRFPNLNSQGLKGGFVYQDAQMRDDLMVIDVSKRAQECGADLLSYCKVTDVKSYENSEQQSLAKVYFKDTLFKDTQSSEDAREFQVYAKQVVSCVGAWTDEFLKQNTSLNLSSSKRKFINPSQGVHLVFRSSEFKLDSAMLLTHPEDGRIFFVIPREDLSTGESIVIVGTTDTPVIHAMDHIQAQEVEINYLCELLSHYFSDSFHSAKEVRSRILSHYVGVRPLTHSDSETNLQSVSREHHIETIHPLLTLVTGGKYTTFRMMAKEIVDQVLKSWNENYFKGFVTKPSPNAASKTDDSLCPELMGLNSHTASWMEKRYGSELNKVLSQDISVHFNKLSIAQKSLLQELANRGFPHLIEQYLYAKEYEYVLKSEDFTRRRQQLHLLYPDLIEEIEALLKEIKPS